MNFYLKVLQNYAQFTGRASRSEFWYFQLFNLVASFIVGFVGGLLDAPVLNSIYSLAVIVPSVAVWIRRMHDVGRSGWFCLVPIYNLILAISTSETQTNAYGPVPNDAQPYNQFAPVNQSNSVSSAKVEQLAKLHELAKTGALNQAEFENEKRKILAA